MIRKIISIITIFFVSLLQANNISSINRLALPHFSILSKYDSELNLDFKIAFDEILRSNTEFDVLFSSSTISKIFTIDISNCPDSSAVSSVEALQNLMVLSLYQKMFKHYIIASETFLNDLLIAKKYWKHEEFYMQQPFFSKNILYNFYSSEYKNQVAIKLAALNQIENKVASILGFCLYGLSKIEKISTEKIVIEELSGIVNQFFELFNVYGFNNQNNDTLIIYNHLSKINDRMQQGIWNAQSEMQQNSKTNFLVDHCVGVSCAALVAISTVFIYLKNKEAINLFYQQGKIAAPNFWQEYIVNPVVGLKEVLWDQKTKKLQHVEHFPDIPETQDLSEYDGYSTILVNPILNPFVRAVNAIKKDLMVSANSWKDASEKTLNTKIDEANDTIIKNNQINMYLATIGPVLLMTYGITSLSYKAYSRYIKHENWYLPMRYIIHSVDQLINKIVRSSSSGYDFVDDGKLYMLLQHFKSYIICLNNEELFLMHDDIEELLSFDLNYAQKKGVVDRMYKTYEFLK